MFGTDPIGEEVFAEIPCINNPGAIIAYVATVQAINGEPDTGAVESATVLTNPGN